MARIKFINSRLTAQPAILTPPRSTTTCSPLPMKSTPSFSAPRAPRCILPFAAIISVALLFAGCTSMQTVSPSGLGNLTAVVRVDDQVDCTLADGTHARFTVTAVEPAALVSGTRRVAAADIVQLEVKRVDAVKTAGVVVGVAGVAALSAAAAHRATNGITIGFLGK